MPAPGRDGDFFALGGDFAGRRPPDGPDPKLRLVAALRWGTCSPIHDRRLATLIEATTVPSDDLLALLQRQGAKPPVFLLQPHAVQALYQGIRPRRGSGFLCPVLEEIISSSAWRLVRLRLRL